MKRRLCSLAGTLALSLPLSALAADPSAPAPLVLPTAPAAAVTVATTPAPTPANVVIQGCCPNVSKNDDGLGWLNGGAAFYYLKPYLQTNTAYVTTVLPGTPTSQVIETTFPAHYDPAMAFWLGWTSPSGIGVRARYFYFDQSSPSLNLANTTTPAPQTTVNPPLANFLPLSTGGTAFGSPGTVLNTGIGTDQITFGSDLKINALDLELSYTLEGTGWTLTGSAGGRYMYLEQGYHASLINNGAGNPVSEVQTLEATRKFTGGGPVAGLFGMLQLGKTNLSFVGGFHGSLLVGHTAENVGFTQTVTDPTGLIPPGIPGTLRITPSASRTSDHVMPVAELEIGMQYDMHLGDALVFFRATCVNQTYFDAGNASQATGNLGLFGVQCSAGLNY